MHTYLVAFVLSFAVAAGLTPLLRILAPLIGGVDQAQSSRKIHKLPIPRIGGVAIVAAFFVPLVGLFIYENEVSAKFLQDQRQVVGLFVGGLCIALLGFYDDLHGASAKLKFVVQFAVAGVMFWLGYRIEAIANPFGAAPMPLGVLSLPFTMLWIVGIINAMNLIDGLDGLAGGVAAIAIGLIFAVAFKRPDVLMCLFMAALGGSVIGFLLYNFNPATIFMGDTGSMFLGFVLASTSIVSSQKSSAAVAMLVPIIGLGLPIADTLLAMLRRALRGRPLFSADREHIHHKLIALGLTHRQAVLVLYGVCLTLAAFAFMVAYADSREVGLLLAGLGTIVVVALRRLGYLKIDSEQARQTAQMRERNQNLRSVVRAIGDRLHESDRVDQIWDTVKSLGPTINAREMSLSLVVSEHGDEQIRNVLSWRHDEPAAQAPTSRFAHPCVVRFDLEGKPRKGTRPPRVVGEIVVTWTDGRQEIQRDDEMALELLVEHLEAALARVPGLRDDSAVPGELTPAPDGQGGSNVFELRRRSEGK